MRLKINRQFSFKIDLFSNEKLSLMNYNMGEVDQILTSNQLTHVSLADREQQGLFYQFKQNIIPQKKSKFELIYISNQNETTIKTLNAHKYSANSFYYSNLHSQRLEEILLSKNCQRLNVVSIFKKSSLIDWTVIVKDTQNLKINCVLLNTFMSLGAKIIFETTSKDLISLGTYELSLQHGIELFRKKQS